MLSTLRTFGLAALAALLLAGCLGWGHGYGPHHGRWDSDRPYGPRYGCVDPQTGQPAPPPCPYQR